MTERRHTAPSPFDNRTVTDNNRPRLVPETALRGAYLPKAAPMEPAVPYGVPRSDWREGVHKIDLDALRHAAGLPPRPVRQPLDPATENVVYMGDANGTPILVRVTYIQGHPSGVELMDWRVPRWLDKLWTGSGGGASVLRDIEMRPRDQRRVPRQVAASYGNRTHRCLLCSRELRSPQSVQRGIGDDCLRKVRG